MSTASIGTPHGLIAQELLNLDVKERSNLFPWRGQFSPQLVELFLKEYGQRGDIVFDPFAGVGTTLLEATKLGMRSRGTELNPSAFMMAQSVEWVRYSVGEREKFFSRAGQILSRILANAENISPFEEVDTKSQAHDLASHIRNETISREVKHILVNTLIRGMAGDFNFHSAMRSHCSLLKTLPNVETSHYVFHADARQTPIATGSINLVVTSPPYINVFNYHENNRAAMELLGWDILGVAKAELGSNRKNRANRFLTVVQYCLDMSDVMIELKRVLTKHGKVILVVGRESMVRGVPFENGELVSSLATNNGFKLMLKQERSFINRFGQRIFEDILHLEKYGDVEEGDPREIATSMLLSKRNLIRKQDVMDDLESAIAAAEAVIRSPVYEISMT